jgi:hypothetical protein
MLAIVSRNEALGARSAQWVTKNHAGLAGTAEDPQLHGHNRCSTVEFPVAPLEAL